MSRLFLFILFLNIGHSLFSQITLKPHIGQNQVPADSDSMCFITNYLGSFEKSGYQPGDTVNDFTLYDQQNNEFTLSKILSNGKPIILISSSYTCPIFRGKVPQINEVYEKYKDKVNFYIVYTVEAHPAIDISPYFGKVNTSGANETEGVLYRQPKLYRDRKSIVADMLKNIEIKPPVLLDGPCNEWWYHYGPAPNNATVINIDGTVFSKHDWLNRTPNDLACDLEKLINQISDCSSSSLGVFTHEIISDTLIKGQAGDILYGRGVLKNDTKYRVDMKAVRLKKSIPSTWETSMCLDICYGPDVDTAYFYLQPAQQLTYYIDFFTDTVPANGTLRIGFANSNDNSNRTAVNFFVSTLISKSNDVDPELILPYAYPNPFTQFLTLSNTTAISKMVIRNLEGKVMYSQTNPVTIDLQGLESGIYFLHYYNNVNSQINVEKIVKR